jgi:hypothetical protein
MNKKYIDFYKKFILQTKTVSNGGVDLNSDFSLLKIYKSYIYKDLKKHICVFSKVYNLISQ